VKLSLGIAMAERKTKRWYLAVLVVTSRVGDCRTTPLVDLQYRLLQAADTEGAYRRALELGAAQAHSYQNADGEGVHWEFIGLNDLRELLQPDLYDGVEVFNTLRREAPEDFLCPKAKLQAFWFETNKDRTARELLGG
jgi:hypothetical protein